MLTLFSDVKEANTLTSTLLPQVFFLFLRISKKCSNQRQNYDVWIFLLPYLLIPHQSATYAYSHVIFRIQSYYFSQKSKEIKSNYLKFLQLDSVRNFFFFTTTVPPPWIKSLSLLQNNIRCCNYGLQCTSAFQYDLLVSQVLVTTRPPYLALIHDEVSLAKDVFLNHNYHTT